MRVLFLCQNHGNNVVFVISRDPDISLYINKTLSKTNKSWRAFESLTEEILDCYQRVFQKNTLTLASSFSSKELNPILKEICN
jgi:hypothetical protein